MKTKKLTIAIALMAITFIGTSCGNKQQKAHQKRQQNSLHLPLWKSILSLPMPKTLQGKKLPLKAFAHIPANMVQRKSS